MTSEHVFQDDLAAVKRCKEAYERLRSELAKVIVGQEKIGRASCRERV